jgi:RNA polymerase sigma factor (sigma-70 family)
VRVEGIAVESWVGLGEIEADLREFLARRCRDASEVDDVLQETYLRAARHRHALTDTHKLRGWAMRIASNALRDLQRRNSRLPRADLNDGAFDLIVGTAPDPARAEGDDCVRVGAEWVPRGAALRQLAETVCELKPGDRQVLESYYGGGSCGERTARECGLPRPLVKVRLFRARRRLAHKLRRRLLDDLDEDAPH